MELFAKTEAELAPVAKYLIELSQQYKVFTFTGDLGAGKTTLIKELCKQLGVQDTVSSPTFGLVNIYHTKSQKDVYHFDCYRLKDISEVYDIGFEEYVDSGNICFIEWPEIVEPLLPPNYIAVTITIRKDSERQFSIKTI
jgi:tRNA threonylcarbamoyladenosine biosynthesis protein TsaE